MFVAQVVDDLSDTEAPVHSSDTFDDGQPLDSEGLGEGEIDPEAELHVLPEEDDGPDGAQYNEDAQPEDSYYEEYDGYAAPSDDDDLKYLRCMRAVESDSKSSPTPLGDTQEVGSETEVIYPQLEDSAWELHRDAIRERYQRLHWFPHDQWEFRPRVGVTHIRNCVVCVEYKEHCIAAEALAQDLESEAWRNCDNYERDLIQLGWTLAFEDYPPDSERDSRAVLGAENDKLTRSVQKLENQIKVIQRTRDEVYRRNKELNIILEQRSDGSEQESKITSVSREGALERHNQDLTVRLETSQRVRDNLVKQLKEIREELEYAKLTSSLHEDVANYWKEHLTILNTSLASTQPQAPMADVEDVGLHPDVVRAISPKNWPDEDHCAAARDQIDTVREREFRSAHTHRDPTGQRPKLSSKDRHCMAVHVKVNGLDAYALLDSGCTTVSVTHDFARVAKLRVMQLENPVMLQLGTVGSRSMINFGAVSRLELGTINDDNAYMDVVNIDRYDMIVGIPFIRNTGSCSISAKIFCLSGVRLSNR
jgi:hypothetical protein